MYRYFSSNKPLVLLIQFLGTVTLFFNAQVSAQESQSDGLCKPSTYNIVFFRPDAQRNRFWAQADRFAIAVAEDFSIELEIIAIDDVNDMWNGFGTQLEAILQREPLPDAIVSVLYGAKEYLYLSQFEQLKIPLFTINTSLDDKVLALTSLPRSHFQNWVGHMSPNEVKAGSQLVEQLFEVRRGKSIAFIAGSAGSKVNGHRLKGALQQAQTLGLDVVPPIYTDWSRNSAEQATVTLLKRVNNIDMVWTAGPEIAMGVNDVLSAQAPNTAIGSFDWSPDNIQLLTSGGLDVSLGGHAMEAGWALVLLYDYLSGMDFKEEAGVLLHSSMNVLNADNIQDVKNLLSAEYLSGIDFQHYSRCLNEGRSRYLFDVPHPHS